MPDTSSSRRIAQQFKGRNTPEMIPFESLQLLGKVGAGSSGVVFEGELKGTSVAVKRLNLILDAATLEQFLSEVNMLTKVTHPNVVLFFGVSFDDRDHDCYLVTEYCHRGNLQEYLEMNPKMTRPLKLQMAVDVARGMNFLHQSEIIHRDLKSVS
jgi:serine/threonine protein kinase